MRNPLGRVAMATLLLTACLLVRPAPSAAGLIGYWSFDGCSTSDLSGNGDNLNAYSSPVCTAGRFGGAWQFDGSSQYLDAAPTNIFEPGARSWSVSAWFKTTSNTGTQMLVDWYRCGANPGCTTVDAAVYNLGLTNGQPYWNVRDNAGVDLTVQDTTGNLADANWHLAVGTLNAVTDSSKLYIDGAYIGSRNAAQGNLSTGGVSIPLVMGRHYVTGWGSPGYYYNGAIDKVRIYDNELSARDAASLFTSNATASVGPETIAGFSIDGGWPNPTHGGRLVVAFTLPSSSPARVALYDISGRLVTELPVGAMGAGHHVAQLHDGRGLAPGIYMVRLLQEGHALTRRMTMLD